jgi:putative ATP-dependent endonuclease of OLD family
MRMSRIEIENFRNFRHVNVLVGPDLVIVGENGVGKSTLRLVSPLESLETELSYL